MHKKVAVVLFNLGGPDSLENVKPFLFNLFNDKFIIGLKQPLRYLLAHTISRFRGKSAQANYSLMGGKSPLLDWTQKQASALEDELNASDNDTEFAVFVCMRYWHPRAFEVANKIKAGNYDEVIMLPLYPQFSTTTTNSSYHEWDRICKKIHLKVPTKKICCYPTHDTFIESHVKILTEIYKQALKSGPTRILFSAHGLPKKLIINGDPYEHQVQLTVESIMGKMMDRNIDYQICYQSKVGPLEWLTPSISTALQYAAQKKLGVLIVPVAFVSEHIETLVELDIEYKDFAKSHGVPHYFRAPALGLDQCFIKALKELCLNSCQRQDINCLNKHKCCLRLRGDILQ